MSGPVPVVRAPANAGPRADPTSAVTSAADEGLAARSAREESPGAGQTAGEVCESECAFGRPEEAGSLSPSPFHASDLG